ncbi:uncharacterized protein N7482_006858 [Penicillium canariense]|uniref:Uncharacterized protein n=1 Tax=Penicillium canariense TaxID=189055 RepID=A0A9W9HVL1_9EURO|nr:uncharacterized protein N7482_006858 [Penicillium canariense]KAJ5159854.1 hypothetical protein N7482_006858 [Penicillium canariense]
MVASELGTYANPIVIEDHLAPLGSASNPIVIQVDEGWCRDEPDQLVSDADTEIMATPEFWGTLTGANFAVPVKVDAAIDSSVRVLIGSLSDHEALKVTVNSSDASRESPRFKAVRKENLASVHGVSEQSTEQGKASKTEEPEEARSVPDTSPMTRNVVPQETSI